MMPDVTFEQWLEGVEREGNKKGLPHIAENVRQYHLVKALDLMDEMVADLPEHLQEKFRQAPRTTIQNIDHKAHLLLQFAEQAAGEHVEQAVRNKLRYTLKHASEANDLKPLAADLLDALRSMAKCKTRASEQECASKAKMELMVEARNDLHRPLITFPITKDLMDVAAKHGEFSKEASNIAMRKIQVVIDVLERVLQGKTITYKTTLESGPRFQL